MARAYGWTDPAFFYSRRVGRTPQGTYRGRDTPTCLISPRSWRRRKSPEKIGENFDLGIIGARTTEECADIDLDGIRSEVPVEPATTYGVARGLKEFADGGSGLGFIGTAAVRDLSDDTLSSSLVREAYAAGVDGWTFLDADRVWSLSGWAGATLVRGSAAAITACSVPPFTISRDGRRLDRFGSGRDLAVRLGRRLFLNKQKGNVIFNAAFGAMSPGFESNDLGYHSRAT